MPEQLSKNLLTVLKQAEGFVAQEILPRSERMRHGEPLAALGAEVRAASKREGFFYKTQPEAFGGAPAGALELTMLREYWASANSELTRFVFGPGPGILHEATGELASQFLKPVMAGEKRGAFGFTEPDNALRPTWAVLAKDELTLNGQKSYVTGGDTADFLSILVNVEDPIGAKLGTAMVVVDREADGVILDDTFTSMEGGGHAAFRFEAVKVPSWQMIGKLGEGMPRALANIGNVRLMVAAEAMGMSLWALDFLNQHLLAPHRTGGTLGDKEGVRLRYAELRIQVFAGRSVLYRAARRANSADNSVNEVIAAKVFCTEVAGTIVDWAVQLVGGQALVVGHPLEALYRRVRALRLVEGANDLLRLNLAKGNLELGKGDL
ncbi:MAG: acyl-CoA dehydrogenase [Pseudomonadales bacterium]|nr:acyl-CoA dehydrogenase [Pseudomonadales bacterium]